jgi:hypothetical protein
VKLTREIQIRVKRTIWNVIIKQTGDRLSEGCGAAATGKMIYDLLTGYPQGREGASPFSPARNPPF